MVDGIRTQRTSLPSIFLIFLRLGLTSFGGPVAHLAYFRTEFVARRRWLSDHDFGDIVALCQFLPGPASSQVGIAIGLTQRGPAGAILAWIGFTLPSAALMIGFAYGKAAFDPAEQALWLHGLLIVAVAIVAHAVWGMARTFAADRKRAAVMLLATLTILEFQSAWTPFAVLAAAAVFGWRFLPRTFVVNDNIAIPNLWPRWIAHVALILFFALAALLPVTAILSGSHIMAVIDRFYRVGALVFGGGHVVLPMLGAEVLPQGWIGRQDFMAGYGAVQAVPGPLFTFAAFLGAAMIPQPNGWLGGLIALCAIFLPSFLMVIGALPYWQSIRRHKDAAAALTGVNAAVVGILLAALYNPVWTSAIQSSKDIILALAGFAALQLWRVPPWIIVVATTLTARFLI